MEAVEVKHHSQWDEYAVSDWSPEGNINTETLIATYTFESHNSNRENGT